MVSNVRAITDGLALFIVTKQGTVIGSWQTKVWRLDKVKYAIHDIFYLMTKRNVKVRSFQKYYVVVVKNDANKNTISDCTIKIPESDQANFVVHGECIITRNPEMGWNHKFIRDTKN